jgi:hypothetical protein
VVQQDGVVECFSTGKVNPLRLEQADGYAVVKQMVPDTFFDLAAENTHLVTIVLCRFSEGEGGRPVPNNYIVTAYQREIG